MIEIERHLNFSRYPKWRTVQMVLAYLVSVLELLMSIGGRVTDRNFLASVETRAVPL